jgi:hypothetical protein
MVKALTIGISVMTGILIGRVQIVENHEANEAIVASERAAKRAAVAKREAQRTRVLLDKTERRVVDMWPRLEPMLEDYSRAETLIDRDAARRRIQSLRWEMDVVDATITASREAAGDDRRTATRQAYVKQNFGD